MISEAIERIFREETGRIVAGLIGRSGSFDLAEESMQDAFTAALETWPRDGIPQNPSAWITTVAYRKLIDRVRKDRRSVELVPALLEAPMPSQESEDDRLRLIFTCCHPALNREAQVALTLRTLGGLTTPEIARAFLLPEATLAQRLVRAKRKISGACIPYEVPAPAQFGERLDAVRSVIYLIFNEGYTALRAELSTEAIRLGRMLEHLMPGRAENLGLLALMLLQDSRRAARVDGEGQLVTLDHQDRALWNLAQIAEGLALVRRGFGLSPPGIYLLQAAIAGLHSEAKTPAETDWPQIVELYGELMRIWDSPVVALNRAAAVAMSEGPDAGLSLLSDLAEPLDGYYLFHAARADLLRRAAVEAYRRALPLTENTLEQQYLQRRLGEVDC